MTRRGLHKISDGGRDLQTTVVDLWGVSPPSMKAARGIRCVKAQTREGMDVFCCTYSTRRSSQIGSKMQRASTVLLGRDEAAGCG